MIDKHSIRLNHQQRRRLASIKRKNKHSGRSNKASRVELTDRIVYSDSSFKDKAKVAGGKAMQYLKDRLSEKNKIFDLPQSVATARRPLLTSCILINRDAKPHAFLPDRPPRHCLLVTRSVARKLVSAVCMFVRITANTSPDGDIIDGSWAIVPAEYRMMQATTIQTLRKRPLWFLRRYPYEISFDGRVQPAHLLFDYGLNPMAKRQRLWLTSEYVQIKDTDRYNSFFRFWLHRPPLQQTDSSATLSANVVW